MNSSYSPKLVSDTLGSMLNLWEGEPTHNANFSFKKIIDTTIIHDSASSFYGFGLPSLSPLALAFIGYRIDSKSNQFDSGIYVFKKGNLARLIDRFNTPYRLPLQHFISLSLSGDNIAFYSTNLDQSYAGIFGRIGKQWLTIADTKTPIPTSSAQAPILFHHFSSFAMDGDRVLFGGANAVSGEVGIYISHHGKINSWLGSNGTGSEQNSAFGKFLYPSCRNGRYAFYGSNRAYQGGIYTQTGTTIHCLVDTTTQIPGSNHRFAYLSPLPRISREAIAFDGSDAAFNTGIYLYTDRGLETVVDTQTPVPGSKGTFSFFYDSDEILYALDGIAIAFVGYEASNPHNSLGIYTTLGGHLSKVIDVNDSLDHKIITSLRLGSEGFCEGAIAFVAGFSDGSQGIYVAQHRG